MKQLTNSGFSILEILIAISILSLITLGVISLTNNATETKERIVKEDRDKLQILSALSVFEWDFSHLYSPLYFSKKLEQKGRITEQIFQQTNDKYERNPHFAFADRDGRPVPIFENPDKNTFEFFTDSNRRRIANSKQSNFAWVKYTLEPEEQNPEENEGDKLSGKFKLVRYFSAENPYNAEKLDTSKLKAQTLLDNIDEIEFSFWNSENKRFTVPLTSVAGAQNLIRAINLKIVWRDKLGVAQTINKVVRPLWPVFDPSQDPDEPVEQAANNQGGGTVPTNQSKSNPTLPPGQDPDDND